MRITPIAAPLPGEHLVATAPVMRPETGDTRARLRLEFWSGRALTAEALELEQASRADRMAWRGMLATPGIVAGLEVALEPPPADPPTGDPRAGYFVHVLPGHGFLANGQDVVVPRPLRVPLDRVPVQYVRIGRPGEPGPAETPPDGATPGIPIDAGPFAFSVDTFPATHVPWAAVLLMVPAEIGRFDALSADDPCELDPSRDAFADERRFDAGHLRLCQLPVRLESLPLLADRDDPRWRNRLAHTLVREETLAAQRQYVRFRSGEPEQARWDTVLLGPAALPWELLGVPLALLASEAVAGFERRVFFLDRSSVARPGGRARPRTRPLVALATPADDAALDPDGVGTPFTWRARVDQFAEHLASFAPTTRDAVTAAAARFQFVPPSGLLPRAALTLLTTAQVRELPLAPNQVPDRAGVNHFFPASVTVEAVPVAVEDLDAALAASAPLAPYNLAAESADDVRLLVPVPQRLFDARLLVVEQEDPIFAATIARFAATRQDLRQRRDAVRARRDALQALASGPRTVQPVEPIDIGQVEPEPTEVTGTLGFARAYAAPTATQPPWEVAVTFDLRTVATGGSLFVRLRLDEEHPPARVEVRWQTTAGERTFAWTEPPPVAAEQIGADGQPLPAPLWRRFLVTPAELGSGSAAITGFTLRIDDGRLALATAGQMRPNVTGGPDPIEEELFWRAQDGSVQFPRGGEWATVEDARLLAPFEDQYEPVFPDGRSLAERVTDIERAVNPAAATPRATALSVGQDGLARVLAELEAEASEADDFIDANFTRAQINLYRIRKHILGQSAAQKLLINPAIALIAEQETATASADQLNEFITAARQRSVSAVAVNEVLNPPPPTGGNPGPTLPLPAPNPGPAAPANLRMIADIGRFTGTAPTLTVEAPATNPRLFDARLGAGAARFDSAALQNVSLFETTAQIESRSKMLENVLGERAETGPVLPPRGLSIGQRFIEPPATQNLAYARSALLQFATNLQRLRLPLVGETVRTMSGESVSLLELQGRALPPTTPTTPPTTSATLRTAAIQRLLAATPVTSATDEAEVTLAALDFTEVKSAILRTIERAALQQRAVARTGAETLALVTEQRTTAAARVVALENALGEARHDVSVARALRQEERQRLDAVNDTRDAIIRDEVTFLAYVRPRTVDTVRRRLPYWELAPTDVRAAVPACLKAHDEAPEPLAAYVELLRHAPTRWFLAMRPLIARLDTPQKLIAVLDATRVSAVSFAAQAPVVRLQAAADAVRFTVLGAQQVLGTLRQRATVLQAADVRDRRFSDFRRDADEHATIGDLIGGRHGAGDVSAGAAAALDQIRAVATCLHAEFAAVDAAIRLDWIERFSQFDRPADLRDLTVLPQYGRLDRATRRRLQEFADWLFGRVDAAERDAVNLINDLVRLCLLLASHAPVNRIIAGHVPRPTPVRPGLQIPIRPVNPELVRVGMQFQVWQASRIVASGRVEDLEQGEVRARVDRTDAQVTTLDPSMRVQFVPAALALFR